MNQTSASKLFSDIGKPLIDGGKVFLGFLNEKMVTKDDEIRRNG